MTNLEAATKLIELWADFDACITYLKVNSDPEYSEAIAMAIMALKGNICNG